MRVDIEALRSSSHTHQALADEARALERAVDDAGRSVGEAVKDARIAGPSALATTAACERLAMISSALVETGHAVWQAADGYEETDRSSAAEASFLAERLGGRAG